MRRLGLSAIAIAAVIVGGFGLGTADIDAAEFASGWTTYRGDAARTGYTADRLPENPAPLWTFRGPAPDPAWPRDERMLFDRASHVVVAEGRAFFGSSADGSVRAVDAKTGRTLWRFDTEGPVRCAPAVWKDRLFVGSDDGFLYALSTKDGSLIEKWRGGPREDRVLGNGRIISRWPVRGGAVIVDDVVYFAAGIWQAEGVFLKALDAATGKELWTNAEAATIYMPQPHGGANAESGISVQGHIAATADRLFVPTGRAVPAAFNRADGEFEYYHLQRNAHRGGTELLISDGVLYNGGAGFFTESGDHAGTILASSRGGQVAGSVAACPDGIVVGTSGSVEFNTPRRKEGADRRGQPITLIEQERAWVVRNAPGDRAVIVAGDKIVAGGEGVVTLVDRTKQEAIWKTEVEGVPYGLAAAEGRLFVSTDRGEILCFGDPRDAPANAADANLKPTAIPREETPITRLAERIVEQTQVKDGYCVDLGCGDGELAVELARLTNLHVVAIDPDEKNVARTRQRAIDAGVYGQKFSVLKGDLANTGLPQMFADLVVSRRSAEKELSDAERGEANRLRRPYGGLACLGKAEEVAIEKRGAPANAGNWTHQYADAANTGTSADEVKGPLSVLWYRDVDLELPQRHGRGPSPLFFEGRIFAEGMNGLRAVDAYNGRTLWEFEQKDILKPYDADHLSGTAITQSNFCVSPEGVFLRNGDTCYRLDHATGEVKGQFTTPGDGPWGYIASENGVLYGSIANKSHITKSPYRPVDTKPLLSESDTLFAIDANSGESMWRYDAEESIRHNAIAIADGKVLLIDRARSLEDLLEQPRGVAGKPLEENRESGKVVCLDAKTGEKKWSVDRDVFGTVLAASAEADVLVMSYQPTRFKLPSETGGRLAAFKMSTGEKLWDREAKYQTRLLLNGDTLVAHGGAWNLRDGEPGEFRLTKQYGCGQLSGGKNVVLFRSGTLSWTDYSEKPKINDFGGVRPGCWINAIPAGGLVLVPDASAGCACSYQNRTWLGLAGE
ncbi:MAG: PQQ-binding-like beta-propeller repeat protein [Planctomycetaceae bacterium]